MLSMMTVMMLLNEAYDSDEDSGDGGDYEGHYRLNIMGGLC